MKMNACRREGRGLEATEQIKEQNTIRTQMQFKIWTEKRIGRANAAFKCAWYWGCEETNSCGESLRCADPTQTFPAPVKYHDSEEGIKLQHAAAFNLGRNTPFKSWNGKNSITSCDLVCVKYLFSHYINVKAKQAISMTTRGKLIRRLAKPWFN